MYPCSSIRGNIISKAVMGEQKQASTNNINLLLLVPFACTTRIKEISPQPWLSPPEPCSHSWCTQGPSSGSTLCRTRGREGDLHVLPKVGSFQPPTHQEFPLASCSLLSSFLATQGSGSWPFCIYAKTLLITLFILPPLLTAPSPGASAPWLQRTSHRWSQPCPQWSQTAHLAAKTWTSTSSLRSSFWSRSVMCKGHCLQLTLATAHGMSLCYAAFSEEGAGSSYPASNDQGSHLARHTAEPSPHPRSRQKSLKKKPGNCNNCCGSVCCSQI